MLFRNYGVLYNEFIKFKYKVDLRILISFKLYSKMIPKS